MNAARQKRIAKMIEDGNTPCRVRSVIKIDGEEYVSRIIDCVKADIRPLSSGLDESISGKRPYSFMNQANEFVTIGTDLMKRAVARIEVVQIGK